jgi:hypothetical protein
MTTENTNTEQQVSNTEPVVSNSEQTQVSEENVNKEETSLQENSTKDKSLEQEEESTETKEKEEINLSEVDDKDKAGEVLKEKGFDYAKLQEEFNATGEISKETREKLAEAGISDEIIDNYIDGQKAKVEAKINEIAEVVGGREEMDSIVKWASNNLSEEEKSSINAIRDENIMKIILKDLKERMEEKEGKTPDYVKGDGGKSQTNIYESQAQMMAEIRDPRYEVDEAYREQVRKKIEASVGAGKISL